MADDVILLEDAWTDFLCIGDDDVARLPIELMIGGALFADVLEAWLANEAEQGRDLREEFRGGLEEIDDGDGWSRVVVGGWAVVFKPLTSEQLGFLEMTVTWSRGSLRGTLIGGIRPRTRLQGY